MRNIKDSWMLEIFLLVIDLIVILLLAAWLIGFRINVTPSLPEGIYQISSESIERGDLVAFCLDADNPFSVLADERGFLGAGACKSGLRPLLKQLVGMPGDGLFLGPEGIFLNGKLLDGTVRCDFDRHGRSLPPSLLAAGTIPKNYGLVLSQDHAGSFDSRYFGLMPLADLKKVRPILTVSRN